MMKVTGNYIIDFSTNGRWEFYPVNNFSHILGSCEYLLDGELYNDVHGNLIVTGKKLKPTPIGDYFPEDIIEEVNSHNEVVIDVDKADEFIEEDDPINKTAIKSRLPQYEIKDKKFYFFDFQIVDEFYYEIHKDVFSIFHEDNTIDIDIVISPPYIVPRKTD